MSSKSSNVITLSKQYSGYKLCENLGALMKECRVTLSELHRNTGVPIATIQRIKTDTNCNPTVASLQPMADFFSITISQLIGDEPLPLDRTIGVYIQKKEQWIKIPIITWDEATIWPNIEMRKRQQSVSTDIDVGGNTFALQIMEDDFIGFQKDSVIIVNPNSSPNERDYVVVNKAGIRAATLKKYLIYEEVPYLAPLNDNFKTVVLNEEYRILGVVIQIRKDLHR